MNIQVATLDSGSGHNFSIDKYPDYCPQCHVFAYPIFRVATAANKAPDKSEWLEIAFQCANRDCQKLFIGSYRRVLDSSNRPVQKLRTVEPVVPVSATFGETISKVSPSFVEVFNQANAAEAMKLDQVVGIGLRKALEFLVKDFAINQKPDQTETIKNTPLGKCISSYIEDPNVKSCATRATWLGNDETHYVRRWEDRDIEDLKRLIHLTVNGIENVLLSQKYLAEMPESGPTEA
jgi:hypothetical protein